MVLVVLLKVCLLEHFQESSYFSKLQVEVSEKPGLTADRIATNLSINVVLMKELLIEAEEKGYLCRDESLEGVRYYDNLILKAA